MSARLGRPSKTYQHNTPDLKILYFGLSIALIVLNIRVQTKVPNKTTTILIRSIVISNKNAPPQQSLKNQNEKQIDTRIQHIPYVARAIKQDRVYEPVFQKEEKRGHFSNRIQTGSFWARLSKKEVLILQKTTDHVHTVRYYSSVCIVL